MVSVSDERGLANWPAMRPTFTTGEPPAKVSTTAICRNTRKKSRMLSARMLGEALGAIAALQQEGLALGDAGQRALQLARLAGKNQRRKAGELLLDGLERREVRIGRNLLDRLVSPAVGRPPLGHDTYLRVRSSMLIVHRKAA